MGYKDIRNKCYELLRGCSLPASKLRHSVGYNGKKSLTFILKNDGRFIKNYDGHGISVWKIKECA